MWTSQSKGQAAVGQRAMRIVEGQRGQNLTICLAISPLIGLVHHSFINGGMMQELFGGFLMELDELLQYNEEPYMILCDNVRSHLNYPNFGDQGEIRYLPKYSPFLNSCKMASSALKAALKRKLMEPAIQQEIYNREAPCNETLHNCRMRVLRHEVEECLPVIMIQKCLQFVTHVTGYMPACLREDDIVE